MTLIANGPVSSHPVNAASSHPASAAGSHLAEAADPAGLPTTARASVRMLPEIGCVSATATTTAPTTPKQAYTGSAKSPVPAQPGSPHAGRTQPGTPYPDSDPGMAAAERLLHQRVELVLRLVLEVVARRRSPAQLAGLVTGPVLRYAAAAAGMAETRDRWARRHVARPRIGTSGRRVGTGSGLHTLRICRPVDGVAEISAVWRNRGRYRALAARFELAAQAAGGPQWRCTQLRLG
jgi:hypothetical protein